MEIVQSFIEHGSWPLVAIIGFVLFGSPLRRMLLRIRGAKAGSVEVQFEEEVRDQRLTHEQLQNISSLTNEELELFLLVSFTEHEGFNYETPLPTEIFRHRIQKLSEAGLLDILNPDDTGANVRHNLTSAGNRFRALVVQSITRMLRELSERR